MYRCAFFLFIKADVYHLFLYFIFFFFFLQLSVGIDYQRGNAGINTRIPIALKPFVVKQIETNATTARALFMVLIPWQQ